MGFGGKMDHVADGIPGKDRRHQFPVGHISFNKSISGGAGEIRQILGIARISEQIQIENLPLRPLPPEEMHEVGTDEAGAPGN